MSEMAPLDRYLLEVLQVRAPMPRSRINRVSPGWRARAVTQALARLAAAGWVEPVDPRHWRLTDAGWRVGPAGEGELPVGGPDGDG